MVAVKVIKNEQYKIPSSICLLWNLQTLVLELENFPITAPSEIWKMTQLRFVQISGIILPDPPGGCADHIVLENLEELLCLYNFKFGEEVVKRIPNIMKKGYPTTVSTMSAICINSNSFLLLYSGYSKPQGAEAHLPHSLKKLTLYCTKLHWDDLTTNIGSFPHLQVLKLLGRPFTGPHWGTVEGQFPSLKFLLIDSCDLEYWTTDGTHFPRLEHLVLQWLKELKEIPLSIGDIPTLQSIQLYYCSDSAFHSAKRILEEQEELGNESLRVWSNGKLIVGEDNKDEDWYE